MKAEEQSIIIWSSLPNLLLRPGRRTGKARRPYRLSGDQISEWKGFEDEVRNETAAHLGQPRNLTRTTIPEQFIVATEAGVSARIVENVFQQLGRVFDAQNIKVRFADRSTGAYAEQDSYPDAIVQGSLEDGKTRIVGEFKSPWTTDLQGLDAHDLASLLGQVEKYMDDYACQYGFLCTYNQAVFVKRVGSYRFQVSKVVFSSKNSTAGPNASLSMRECFYFFARLASKGQWKFHGPRVGNDLTKGTWKLTANLRN